MGEVIKPIRKLQPGDVIKVGEDGVEVIEPQHSHNDILRYMAEELGTEGVRILAEILHVNGLDAKQRVQYELKQLTVKCDALLGFLGSSAFDLVVPGERQRALLHAQYLAMMGYKAILEDRLNIWEDGVVKTSA